MNLNLLVLSWGSYFKCSRDAKANAVFVAKNLHSISNACLNENQMKMD